MGSRDHSVLFLATAFEHTIISKFTKKYKNNKGTHGQQ